LGITPRGVIAAGHEKTVRAAEVILREGGNAFDAALAGLACACVAEPILASLGGGGYLLARTAEGDSSVYDFFVQTPQRKKPSAELDFFPISADFGTAQQEFHIGKGAIAVPGLVRGMFAVHRDLGILPMKDIIAPAVTFAKEGVSINELQAYIFSIMGDICVSTPEAAAIYGRQKENTSKTSPIEEVSPKGITEQQTKRIGATSHQSLLRPIAQGEIFRQPMLADTLESLAIEGEDLFYRGEIAKHIVRDMEDGGGHLTARDFEHYRSERRVPLQLVYRGERLVTNPPPSSGGLLIGFALKLLESAPEYLALVRQAGGFDSLERLKQLAQVMELTSQARVETETRWDVYSSDQDYPLLDPEYLAVYRERVAHVPRALRGTTHISIVDGDRNVASLSVSNGEGAGYVVPGTGIMLNNMLGEEDLNPGGFHRWPTNRRMTSMMAPTVIEFQGGGHPKKGILATGSGGSNRIRSALLQVLVNVIDFQMDVETAVQAPRIHYEDGLFSIENGFGPGDITPLLNSFARHHVWSERNLFFGGAHTVSWDGNRFQGAGDTRRGGVSLLV